MTIANMRRKLARLRDQLHKSRPVRLLLIEPLPDVDPYPAEPRELTAEEQEKRSRWEEEGYNVIVLHVIHDR